MRENKTFGEYLSWVPMSPLYFPPRNIGAMRLHEEYMNMTGDCNSSLHLFLYSMIFLLLA